MNAARFTLPLLCSCAVTLAACGGDEGATENKSGNPGATSTGGTGGDTSSATTSTGAGGAPATTATTTATTATTTGSSTGAGGSGDGGGGGSEPIVRLIAIGDTGEGNAGQNLVADAMSAHCGAVGGCDAVLMLGDNFYDNGVTGTGDLLWGTHFEQPYDRVNLDIPFYVVLGNHDHGPTSSGNRQAQIDYTSLPVGNGAGMRPSARWNMPAAYYDVVIDHVQIFATDTVSFNDSAQESVMAGKVAASSATWKIVTGHHPRYTSGEHYFDNQGLGFLGLYDFQQAIYCGADMFLTGHDHDLEFIDKGRDEDCPNVYFAISGAGAKLRDTNSFVPTDDSQLFFTDTKEGFMYLEFTGKKLDLTYYDKTGASLFTKTITK